MPDTKDARKDEAARPTSEAEESTDTGGEDSTESEGDDEEDEEPKLKYARLTSHLGSVYRNADATSAFMVAGDKMFIGTHNGNIHVISLPSFQPLRVYHAHSASVTSISISPFPPPLSSATPEAVARIVSQHQSSAHKTPHKVSSQSSLRSVQSPRAPKTPQLVLNTPSNAVYIATSSIDGKVCVASLIDEKDVQLRDFARPVQAVALSPQYRSDRTYLSGGLAGNLVVTVGGRSGHSSTSTTTGSAAASAAGWLGSIGLGTSDGKDTVLHSGEGTVSSIKWSLSGKYVVWLNEHGIKIMRSSIDLDNLDTDSAWKRIAHIDRTQGDEWDEMAGVWKGRVEWIDEKTLETDEDDKVREGAASSPATAKLKQQALRGSDRIEKLLVGWGNTIWLINVHPGGPGVGKHVGERSVGRAEIIKILAMDCIISGLSLYTPTLLFVLAYVQNEDQEAIPKVPVKGHKSKASTASSGSEPSGGIRRRHNALPPELKLVDLGSSQEVETDNLTVSRFETLSASDYHLCILPAVRASSAPQTSRSTLETLAGMGSGMWHATVNATNILSSAASVKSGSDTESSVKGSKGGNATKSNAVNKAQAVHPNLNAPGMKVFIHSPFDCVLAAKRDLSDHLSFLLEAQKFQNAWQLIEDHPEVISTSTEKLSEIGPGTPDQLQGSDDFYDDTGSTADSASRLIDSAVDKEKRRIGELWVQQLISNNDWAGAGKACGKVLATSDRWKHWVYVFASADKFDEISDHIPTTHMRPPLPSDVYEVIIAHYIATNRPQVRMLLERWSPDLFDIEPVTTALENQLKFRDVREDSVEDGIKGRDWQIVMESLAKLYVADGRAREALRCYMRLHDADAAMELIKDFHLVDAVADDLPSLVLLRVTKEQKRSASIAELKDVTSEAISLLVNEARNGLLRPEVVVRQLQAKDMPLYLFFYVSSLWCGDGIEEREGEVTESLLSESKALLHDVADLAVHLFATYDRALLMDFLKFSTYYTFEKATQECEARTYVPELVYLYSKTGQTKRALFLIIDSLADVSQAIAFAKSQDDSDLWDDLLNYSMDKPRFIRGLLEEVGTTINPVKLVRRIPEGLEIQGLREGLSRMIKEYVVQQSISEGVEKVLRGEVAQAQNTLRSGQQKGVRFDVVHNVSEKPPTTGSHAGRCSGCHRVFEEAETETLVGFTCGHVWHLSHLLGYGSGEGERPLTPPEERRGSQDVVDEYTPAMHSVGSKVTHARLLRDRIMAGCPVCGDVS